MMQVLFITANNELKTIARDTLETAGSFYMFADSATTAAKLLENAALPDVVVVDLSMSRALDFLKQLKSQIRFANLPVLVIVDEPEPAIIKAALESGAARWITASFVKTTLVNVIRQVIMPVG